MKFVDLAAQHESLKDKLDAAIARVIEDSTFVRGPDVDAFEENWASLVGMNHCISCASGTDALYISLRALGVGLGDEVITTAHSWISTSETISQTGARVVFCDTEDEYFCIDPALIESKLTARTKGIVVVHLFGQPAQMDRIMEIANQHGLWVLEDCAQAHLGEFDGTKVGRFGSIAAFSFYPGKNLGAMGDAGCIVTDRDDLAEFCRLFARHGGKNNHVMEGVCSRMDGLQAAILNVKLPKLAEWNAARRNCAARYDVLLKDNPALHLPAVRPGALHAQHLYVVRVPQRDRVQAGLAELGVPTAINYPRALPFYPAYEYLGHVPQDFPVANGHAEEVLSLPMHPFLTESEQEQVAEALKRVLMEVA